MISPIFFLALGLFGVYTIEFGVVGILPEITERFDVSIAQAGMLVGIFAMVIALFGPFMVLFVSRYNRKKILVMSLFLFALSSLLSAFATNYGVMLLLRVVAALFHPVYFSLAFVAAISLFPKEKATQAAARAFVGTSVGMVLGVPATTYIADQLSFEAAYYFCAMVNTIAGIGIAAMLPKSTGEEKKSFREQTGILRKLPLWMNIGASTFIFAAMFSVYSYAAEYLGGTFGLSGEAVSIMLVLFGVGGVAGNLLAGKWMAAHMVRTALLHPVALALTFLLLYAGEVTFIPIAVLVVLWGATHTSGLIVTQIWLTSEAKGAPEFANALYISFINLGVLIGSAAGGWMITRVGMHGAIWCSLTFLALAMGCMLAKMILFRQQKNENAMNEE